METYMYPVFGDEQLISLDSPLKILLSLTVACIIFLLFKLRPTRRIASVPVVGYRSLLEPNIVLKSRFIKGANAIIHKGYTSMRNKPFILSRFDGDVLVLPMKYLEEIRLMSPTKLNGRDVQLRDLAVQHVSMEFMKRSHLHVDALRNKLAPKVYEYVDKAREELAYGWYNDFPHSHDWIGVNIGHHLRTLIARMTAKTFMGNPTCRDPEWLKIAVDFSLNLASYNFTVKIFPNWMHGLVARFIPARHRMSRQYDIAERVVRELTHQHDLAKRARLKGEEVEEEDTLLNWMLDHGSQSEIEPFQMGVRQCALIFASIHTVAATMSNMLYDLCTNREWLEVLREEVEEISKELGPPIQNTNNNAHAWCTRLDKLDSFIVESQRHHPLSLLIPQRLAHQEIKFKDGMTIPAGSQLAFASYEYSMDPLVNGNPQEFDPMRSYRKRMAGLDQWDLHKASMAHPGNLAFGYGNQGCPGRRFAVSEMKIIMACLLYEFEFKFPEGRTRPKSHHLNQFCFTNQSVTLMMKKL